MTQNRVAPGVPTGGQFAASRRDEVRLALRPEDGQLQKAGRIYGIAERLIAREQEDGGHLPGEHQEDIEAEIRDQVPNVAQEEFDTRMACIGRLAELASSAEYADDTDTESYQDGADEAGLDLDDFPAEDPGPEDVSYDCSAYRSGVINELENRIYREALALIAAEDATHAMASPSAPRLIA